VPDGEVTWRFVYRLDADAVVMLAVFAKKTPKTPSKVIDACRHRLREYDNA
jgi:phage-related protein